MTKHAIPYTPRNTPNRKTPPPGNTKTANTPITPSHHHTITPAHQPENTPDRHRTRPSPHAQTAKPPETAPSSSGSRLSCRPPSPRPPLIPVSCGQLREQRAFSLYRQPLAPPARQTGISAAPSHPHTLTPSHPHTLHPAPRFPFSVSTAIRPRKNRPFVADTGGSVNRRYPPVCRAAVRTGN